jgi:DNA (cytosine-5)-methyltransferase 1
LSEKPPYKIPAMRNIRRRKKNGLTAISTFTGAGGSCLGLTWAGWTIGCASEFVEAARDVYRFNFPKTPIDPSDIREISGRDLLKLAGLKKGKVDLLEGSPPCSDFSMAGTRSKGWGKHKKYSDTDQRVDDLFFEFARILDDIQPRTFVAENVPGLVRGVAKGYFKEIHAALTATGYHVKAALLDSQWLGVPQARKRLFFIGTRSDLELTPPIPAPLPYRYSVRDVLPWIDESPLVGGTGAKFEQKTAVFDTADPSVTILAQAPNQMYVLTPTITGRTGPQFSRVESELDDPMNTIIQSDPERTRYEVADGGLPPGWLDMVDEERGVSIEGYAIEREWETMTPGSFSDKYLNLARPHADEPLPTVTAIGGGASTASVTHPYERRKFSIPELRRLCGFPDDFILTGSYGQRWERLGRAVPPPVSRAIGAAIAKTLATV